MTKSVISLNLGELFSLKLCSRAPRFTGELLPPPHPFSFFPVNLMLISCAYPIRAQCARSLILLEKWGVKTFISSMQSGLLGTISSHSGVKLVSFHHLFQS